jgi:hypothetical protein
VPKSSMILDDLLLLLLLLFSVQISACCFALVCVSRFRTPPQIPCWAVTIVAAAFSPFYSVTFFFWMNFCHLKNQISSCLVSSTEMDFLLTKFFGSFVYLLVILCDIVSLLLLKLLYFVFLLNFLQEDRFWEISFVSSLVANLPD